MNWFILLGIFGAVLLVLGLTRTIPEEADVVAIIVGLVMVVVGVIGTAGTAAIRADKNTCLKETRLISNRDTRWLDGQCYMKADDGKFVPQDWIEKGYERD